MSQAARVKPSGLFLAKPTMQIRKYNINEIGPLFEKNKSFLYQNKHGGGKNQSPRQSQIL